MKAFTKDGKGLLSCHETKGGKIIVKEDRFGFKKNKKRMG
jgi:hypothetical protein